eukprot:TRINITY_DN34_c0_g1_i11.p1 TRINITY_DN34_c0_g1~~TRINITY_DN34_c0_g1_i11.p1  ORF type:complete len:429 (+),score=70.53 TRINITY_DN34_c0_g1_i11:1018-2304(+)
MALARGILSLMTSGGLIIVAKPGDAPMWKRLFAEAGRSDDLLVFSPPEPLRFNFLDYEMRHGGHTRNIVQLIFTIGETLRSGNGSGRGNEEIFWRQNQERLLYNSIEIVKQAIGRVTAPDLQNFILSAAGSPEELATDSFQASFHNRCMEAAFKATKTSTEAHDFELAADFWLSEYPAMAEKTRSSILAGVTALLHVFNTGIVRSLVSGETNVSPDDMFNGKFVLVDMSPSEFGEVGSFVCAGWKYLTQRRVLRRDATESDCINVIWCDEAHQGVNSFDPTYLAQCRSHLGCMVFLSQSLPGYHAALKGESGKQEALSLLANFGTTVVHVVDPETADWAADKLGKRLETFFSGSMAPAEDVFDELFGRNRMTGSFSTHYEYTLQPREFLHGLRTGGAANGRMVDAYVIRSGEPFSSGENFVFATFKQG